MPVGQYQRKNGAARCMVRDAQTREEVGAPPLQHRTIATQDSPIGWPAGVLQKKVGAAVTAARVAHQLQVDALEFLFTDAS